MSERGDTQNDLASALEIAPRSVAAYLASEAYPQLPTFVRICERYSVSLDWMAGLSAARERAGDFVAVVDTEMLRRLLAGEQIDGRVQIVWQLPPGRLVTQSELDGIVPRARRSRSKLEPPD